MLVRLGLVWFGWIIRYSKTIIIRTFLERVFLVVSISCPLFTENCALTTIKKNGTLEKSLEWNISVMRLLH